MMSLDESTPLLSKSSSQAKAPDVSDADIKAVFSKFDTDASGFLDSSELFEAGGSLGVFMDADDVETALKLLDTNGDGKIQYDEFAKWIKNPTATQKSTLQLAGLKMSLLTRLAAGSLKGVKSVGDAYTGVFTMGEFKTPKFTLDIKAVSPGTATGLAQDFLQLGFTIEHNGGVAFQLMGKSIIDSFMKTIVRSTENTVDVTFPDSKTALVTLKARDRYLRRDLSNITKALGGFEIKVEFGWNLTDLVALVATSFKPVELMNFRLTLKGNVPTPMVDEMVRELSRDEFLKTTEFAKQLIAGKKDLVCKMDADFKNFLAWEKSPNFEFLTTPFWGTIFDRRINPFGQILGEISREREAYIVKGLIKSGLEYVGRDIVRPTQIELACPETTVTLTFTTDDTVTTLADLCKAVFSGYESRLGAAMVKDRDAVRAFLQRR